MFPMYFKDTSIENNTCTHAWTPLKFHDASISEAESSQSFKKEGEAEAGMFGATLQCCILEDVLKCVKFA